MEEPDAGRKKEGEDERVVAKIETSKSGLYDSQTISKVAELDLISQRRNLRAKFSTLDSLITEQLVAMDLHENCASDSQVWHADADPNSSTEKLVARSKKSLTGHYLIPHNLTISTHCVGNMEKVFTYVRQKLGRPKEDKMKQVNTNTMICGLHGCVHEGNFTSQKRL